jgi:hypothetical protein
VALTYMGVVHILHGPSTPDPIPSGLLEGFFPASKRDESQIRTFKRFLDPEL